MLHEVVPLLYPDAEPIKEMAIVRLHAGVVAELATDNGYTRLSARSLARRIKPQSTLEWGTGRPVFSGVVGF